MEQLHLDNYFATFMNKKNPSSSTEPTSTTPPDCLTPKDKASQRIQTPSTGEAAKSPSLQSKYIVISDRGEEEFDLREEEQEQNSRKRPRSPINVSKKKVEPSDDEDLYLLLGSQKAREAKAVQERRDEGKREISLSSDEELTYTEIKDLKWNNNKSLRHCERYLDAQFQYEITHDENLYHSFEPFFKDKKLKQLQRKGHFPRVFGPAPVVTATSTGAITGCVLRDYQVTGVQFILDHFHKGMPCILSDDMGLGKTAQVASFLHCLKLFHSIEGPHLIISPLSTLTSWVRELARWAPQLKVVKYHGTKDYKRKLQISANRNSVFVSNSASLLGDRAFFRKRHWAVVIVDEAHILKGSKSNITYNAKKLKACFRVAVTGTPVHNNVTEVWSILGFLFPKYAASYDTSDTDTIQAAENCSRLLKLIMLRRTKESMELGIPPRVDHPVTYINPTPVQEEVLSQLTALALSDDTEGDGHRWMGYLSHQRAVCNHPMSLRVLGTGDTVGDIETKMRDCGIPIDEENIINPSAKLRYLDKVLPKMKQEGHRCLIFSNFTSTLDLIEAMCHLRGYTYERLDGSCNRVERELSIHRFNQPNSTIFLFLVTTNSGGVGVTLTGADTVFLFDAHFNPQMDRQAADRAHRIGQTKTVHIYRLCLRGTVEEKIRQSADRKASLGDFIVESKLSAKEIRELLSSDTKEVSSPTQAVFPLEYDKKAVDPHMIQRIMQFEVDGKAIKTKLSNRTGPRNQFATSNLCFVCSESMRPYEPMYRCIACPKVYHAECCGERSTKGTASVRRNWTCPRHTCSTCGKLQSEEGAIFMCTGCPRAFCFDCLDPRYLVLDDTGSKLLNIQRDYPGMKEELMEERRSNYYISCLYCCGALSSETEESDTDSYGSDSSDSEDSATDSMDTD